jgi:hypothetical protein
MVDRIAKALAKADDKVVVPDPVRYRRLALAALKALTIPTETMIDAAHAMVWFDDAWGVNSRSDFQRAVRAMIKQAIAEEQGTES